MYKKTFLTGIVSAALFVMLSVIPTTHNLTTSAQAAGTGCLPASVKTRLNQIRKKFGKVRVISTHRPGARIAGSGKRSYHASCRAVDFHPPKGKYRAVLSWLKKNHKGGVGSYSCGMHHIHLDNGPRVRFHHCVNKVGTPIRKGRKKRHYAKKKYKSHKKKNYAYKKSYNKPYALGAKAPKSYSSNTRSVYKKTYSIYY
ncbi:MAG: hypothetical protein DHS20C08_19220 [Rhodomicrobium sp.]|nr:MAG: hypothetical protein DHS20C08_19220 [Rhodomicrobium sp.]